MTFRDCISVEDIGVTKVLRFLKKVAFNGQVVLTSRGPLSKLVQVVLGDAFINVGAYNYLLSAEIKIEETDITGNLFIENMSNNCTGSFRNKGWAHKLKCDFLLYYFIEQDRLVISHWPSFYKWLAEKMPSGLSRGKLFPERAQGKYAQMNRTTGRIVPIAVVMANVPSLDLRLSLGSLDVTGIRYFLGRAFVSQFHHAEIQSLATISTVT